MPVVRSGGFTMGLASRPHARALLLLLSASAGFVAAASAAVAAPLPYPEAVAQGRRAATAVLARAGAETCLRGKMTRALLRLSDSCAAAGRHDPLCVLADQAVVVTPMSLPFLQDTARRILDLTAAGS